MMPHPAALRAPVLILDLLLTMSASWLALMMMSDTFWTVLFAGVPTGIAAIATLVIALRTQKRVEKVEHATNSMHDELVKSARIEAHAAGMKEEKDLGLGTLKDALARMRAAVAYLEKDAQEKKDNLP